MKKMIWLIVIIIVVGAIVSFSTIMIKDFSYFESEKYARNESKSTNVLVLCYSRNGNTEAMAKEIARRYNAELQFIEAEAYSRDMKGWRNAGRDADAHTESPIDPVVYDLIDYDLVFIGSPIWWYRPAPPLWTFVKNNDFTGKKVVLYNTFNSRFKQEYIDEFSNLISGNGGKMVSHIYIRKGRAIPLLQKDGNYVMRKTRKLLEIHEKDWSD
jgi:flavodoxin